VRVRVRVVGDRKIFYVISVIYILDQFFTVILFRI